MGDLTVMDADLADPRHQDAVVRLVNMYARDPMGQGRDLTEDVRRDLIAGLRAHPATLILLAFDGDLAVGIAVCFVGFSTFAARPLVNIHDLAVTPEYRGRGVGRALLEHVEAKSRTLGCAKLTLEVNADNLPAQALYTQCGFGDGKSDGRIGRVWFLQKRLERAGQ
jgi:ribosomal protein S18 acetylase RimI-like enzyme